MPTSATTRRSSPPRSMTPLAPCPSSSYRAATYSIEPTVARILVDSDVLVDHLRGHRRFKVGRDAVHVSAITQAELFAGRATEESRVRLLLAAMIELPVSSAVAERAGRIRRTTTTRLADALIAATAIEHGLTLVTRNATDFEAVRGLRIRTPPAGWGAAPSAGTTR